MAVLSAMQHGGPAPRIFLDYIGQTILTHATYVYGGTPPSRDLPRGNLAPWQTRRAKEFLSANLYADISLASVATECNLSVSHFAHAFRRTFGRSPHRCSTKSSAYLTIDTRRSREQMWFRRSTRSQQVLQASAGRESGQVAQEQKRPSISSFRQDPPC